MADEPTTTETSSTNPTTGFETVTDTTTEPGQPTTSETATFDGAGDQVGDGGYPVTRPEGGQSPTPDNGGDDDPALDDTALTNAQQQQLPPDEMLREANRLNQVNKGVPVTDAPLDLDHVVTTTTSTLGQVYNDLADRLQSWLDKGSTPGGGSMIGAEIAVMNELIAHLRHGTIPMV